MTRNNNNKLRAVFLAALMFLWLFAGTVAFAGGAAQDVSVNVADGDALDGTEFFQGQEVEIDLSHTALSDESVNIREVTGQVKEIHE